MVIQAKELNTSELYYKIPQAFNYPPYDKLSLRAEKLYGVILWRLRGSVRNGFVDDLGVYCNFSVKELEPILKCSNRVVIKAKKELTDAGLLVEKRRFNASNKIYLEHPVIDETSFTEMTNGHITNDETSFTEMTNGHTIESYIYRVNNKELDKEELEETSYLDIGTPPPPPPKKSMDFGQFVKRSGIDFNEIVFQKLLGYIGEDGMDLELVKLAITAAAENGVKSPKYVFKILNDWKAKGFTKLEEGLKEQEEFEARKSSKKKNSYIDEEEAKRMQEKYGF